MKKILCMMLALLLAMSMAACGGEGDPTTAPTTGTNTPTPANDGYIFNYNGTAIVMHADAAPILAALGEPKTYTEEASCAFEGKDKTYFFGSFYLQTYPIGDKDYVYGVWFADDSVTTDEGVYVGMSQKEVEAAYGTAGYNGSNAFIMTKGASRLTVILTDGKVSSIQYDAVVE